MNTRKLSDTFYQPHFLHSKAAAGN